MPSSWADSSRGEVGIAASRRGGERCFLRMGRGHGQYVLGMLGRGQAVHTGVCGCWCGCVVMDCGRYMKVWNTRAMSIRLRYIGDRIPRGWETERRVGEMGGVCAEAERRPLE